MRLARATPGRANRRAGDQKLAHSSVPDLAVVDAFADAFAGAFADAFADAFAAGPLAGFAAAASEARPRGRGGALRPAPIRSLATLDRLSPVVAARGH